MRSWKQRSGKQNAHQERLKSRRPFVPAAQKLLDSLTESDIPQIASPYGSQLGDKWAVIWDPTGLPIVNFLYVNLGIKWVPTELLSWDTSGIQLDSPVGTHLVPRFT